MAATWMTQAWLSALVAPAAAAPGSFSLWSLFAQSFDLFTVALVAGSLVGIGVIARCLLEVRQRKVLPRGRNNHLRDLAREGKLESLRDQTERDDSFVGATARAASTAPLGAPPGARRDAAELVASEQCARLFRTIEPLNLLGNLGPLIGLAGTVWGMILAFTSLGETGGQAGAADLSLGISKALFHTLLGLLLAIPCLAAYGVLKARVDRLCNRGMILAGEIVDLLEQADRREAERTAPLRESAGGRDAREEPAAAGWRSGDKR